MAFFKVHTAAGKRWCKRYLFDLEKDPAEKNISWAREKKMYEN